MKHFLTPVRKPLMSYRDQGTSPRVELGQNRQEQSLLHTHEELK